MNKHLNIKVFGLVQGVFFRQNAKIKVQELNLKGFVRNEPDGSVCVELEGEEEKLKEFVQWCQKGPPLAQVEKVEVKEDQIKGYEEFRIVW